MAGRRRKPRKRKAPSWQTLVSILIWAGGRLLDQMFDRD